jgi:diguanylate cyclase (GGDEF)-like protein/PAS domain S-box-containing protein
MHAGPHMNNRRDFAARTAQALQRPLVRFGVMLGAIFSVELALMLAADRLQLDMTGWAGALVDAATLTAIASVVMWPLVVNPLRVALRTEQARARAILDTASDAIITIDDQGIIQEQNRAARIMFGVSDEDAVGHNVSMIVPSPHRERHDGYLANYRRTGVKHVIGTTQQLEAVRMDGVIFPIELSISEVQAGSRRLYTAIIRDVTERKRLGDEIQKMAHHDQLTGLANRALFQDRLSQAVALARRHRGKLGLLYFDLDRFKPVNDNYGHTAGDMVLCAVAERLRESVRESDTVARLGGDEFAVILAEIGSRPDAQAVAEKLKVSISEPYPLDDVIVSIGASIGIAVFPDDAALLEDLVKVADQDMYRQKEARKAAAPGDESSPVGLR